VTKEINESLLKVFDDFLQILFKMKDVDDEKSIADRRNAFVQLHKEELVITSAKGKHSSILHKFGVVYQKMGIKYFKCMCSSQCYDSHTVTLSKNSTCHGTNHLKDKHRIEISNASASISTGEFSSFSSSSSSSHPSSSREEEAVALNITIERLLELKMVKTVITDSLPLNTFSPSFREILDERAPKISNKRVKCIILDYYWSWLEHFNYETIFERNYFVVRFTSHSSVS
jgi:hypothetical protein